MNAGKMVRLNKEKHPELYCPAKNCLWRLKSGPCPKHALKECETCRMYPYGFGREACECKRAK